jgi:hypothetical protein
MLQLGVTGSKGLDPEGHKRKRNNDTGDVEVNEPWKMRGKRTNYKFLHDPYPEEEDEEEESFLTKEKVYTIITRESGETN